jgi:hypothetical protein
VLLEDVLALSGIPEAIVSNGDSSGVVRDSVEEARLRQRLVVRRRRRRLPHRQIRALRRRRFHPRAKEAFKHQLDPQVTQASPVVRSYHKFESSR